MIVKFFGRKHIVAIISYVLFLIAAFLCAGFGNLFGLFTFWLNFSLTFVSFASIFILLFISWRDSTPPFFFMITKIAVIWFYIETGLGILLLIFMLLWKQSFPGLVNLIQIPVVCWAAIQIIFILVREKYVKKQIREEKATVREQIKTLSQIDTVAAQKYGFEISDSIETLVNKIRTLALPSSADIASIDGRIYQEIEHLNAQMQTSAPKEEIIDTIKEMHALIENRRNINRRF